MTSPPPPSCPACHAPIPAGAPDGFCPACVLRGAEETGASSGSAGPSLEAVQAAFPDLEIESLIGQGGMGFVYKARQPSLDRTVALKILAPDLSRDPAFAERFAREARVLGKLKHPNIVAVYGHGQSGGFYFLLMEYVDGVNLRQGMRAGRFTPEQALGVVPGICDALQAAHAEGVWHRDIKPENILLDSQGRVKVVDFGIARLVGDPQRNFTLTITGAMLGSAAYMAPEQHEKPHDVDHRADIYSLGVVIYEMLTGELPLGRFPAPSQRAAVDGRVDEVVFRTLEKERGLRQQSAGEVKTEVSDAAQPPPVRRPAAGSKSASTYGRLPLGFFLAGIFALPLLPLLTAGTLGRTETFFLMGVLLLMGLIFGLLSWKTRADKFVVVVVAAIFVMAAVHTYQQRLVRNGSQEGISIQKSPDISGTSASPVTASTEDAAQTSQPAPASAPVPSPDVLTTFRTMNRLANERDLTDFQTYSPQRQVLITGDAPLTEKMKNFRGELLRLHLVQQKETRPAPIGFGVMRSSAEVVALIRTSDGTSVWRQYRFQKKAGEWKYLHPSSPTWKSTALIKLTPSRHSDTILLLNSELQGRWNEATAEPVSKDHFIVTATAKADAPYGPEAAQRALAMAINRVTEIFRKAGWEEKIEVLSPPDLPLEPMYQGSPPPAISADLTATPEAASSQNKAHPEEADSIAWNTDPPPLPAAKSGDAWAIWSNGLRNAETLHRRGNLEEALQSCVTAVESARTFSVRAESPRFRPLARCLLKAGDLFCELGKPEQALPFYRESLEAWLKAIPEEPSLEAETRRTIIDVYVKTGDVHAALDRRAEALENYRTAAGSPKWTSGLDTPEAGRDLNQPFEPSRLTALLSGSEREQGAFAWRRELFFLVCRAAAEQNADFRSLPGNDKLKEEIPLALAVYDYALNRNEKALDYLLNRMAAQPVGSDGFEPVALSYLDEWTRSYPAVESHFTTTDGAGGLNRLAFTTTRQFLFPRNYLLHKYPDLKGAPLPQARPARR